MTDDNPTSGQTRIRLLDRETDLPAPSGDLFVEIRSNHLTRGLGPEAWAFAESADLLIPFLVDLPATTHGDFTDLAIDLVAPIFPEHPDYIYEVDLRLRGKVIGTKTFRNYTQRHQFIISTQLLFEEVNELKVSARPVSGGPEAPRFFVKIFYVQKDRLVRTLEKNSIWVFSTARSGSTWLSHDLLCRNDRVRPMDEPGIGKMFAPLDWIAERFYNLPEKADYFESGFDYEVLERIRENQSSIAPFERAFVYARQENQIWSEQNWAMYLGILKDAAFRHVINEWGMIDYDAVVFKMPNEAHAADVVMRAFPEAFMIFMMRDGRDVMKSRFSPFASRDLAETSDPDLRLYAIAFYAHFWNFQVDIMAEAFANHAPERRLLVHYEDLRRDTMKQMRVIFDRIGLPITDGELAELTARSSLEQIPDDQKGPDMARQTGQIGRFADVFSDEEIELMEAIMGPNLRRFGYATRSKAATDAATCKRHEPEGPALSLQWVSEENAWRIKPEPS